MLFYFILGILFIFVCIPLLQNFLSIVESLTQYIVYIFALKIYNIKKQYTQEQQQGEEEKIPMGFHTEAIGFIAEPEEEEEQED